ncbi:hypothetical protein FSARC_12373 [Fusarium sarcochroum]|uniref:Uncharacterized protein n=1 Tax=Fusarium sarcochroum TaxID=1208366 RepID=A0A8H4T8T8_9HYPO|nr:hypothetical protein FSARC_12373 [Fusarium sarcochroum]
MSADYQMAISAVDAEVLTQYISDMFDNPDFVPEVDPTDIDIDDYIHPSYDLAPAQPVDSPSSVFITEASVGPESTMEATSPSAKTTGSVDWSDDGFQQLNDFIKADDDFVEDLQQASASTALTPAARVLRVASVEPRQVEFNQPAPYQPAFHQPVPHQPAPNQPMLHQQAPIQPAAVQPEPQPQLQLPISLPAVQGVRPDADRPPKKYRPQPIARNRIQQWLVPKLKETTFQYQGYIDSEDAAMFLRRAFSSLSSPNGAHVTNPANDMTFPSGRVAYSNSIRQIFEAICDWSSPREWRAKMGHKLVKEWIAEVNLHRRLHGLTTDLSSVSDDDIAPPPHRMPPVEEQWKNVIHQRLSDVEIEILCSQILDQAMLAQKGENYIPLWSNTETQWEDNADVKLQRKDQNKAGNDRKRCLIEQGGGSDKKRPRI